MQEEREFIYVRLFIALAVCVCVFFSKRVESINSLMEAVFCEEMCVCVFFLMIYFV